MASAASACRRRSSRIVASLRCTIAPIAERKRGIRRTLSIGCSLSRRRYRTNYSVAPEFGYQIAGEHVACQTFWGLRPKLLSPTCATDSLALSPVRSRRLQVIDSVLFRGDVAASMSCLFASPCVTPLSPLIGITLPIGHRFDSTIFISCVIIVL